MQVHYQVEIKNPETHMVSVSMKFKRENEAKISVFLPSWSPGSYLMREYAKHVRTFKALNSAGEFFYFEQVKKGEWEIDFEKSDVKTKTGEVEVKYEVFCHELTVRTSHIDEYHAFLHGPTYLMGVKNQEIKPTIEFKFPGLWSKLHTALDDISEKRDLFLYKADNYDDLIDSPVEIGCHESDGFMHDKKEHHLIFVGNQYPHKNDLKKDFKTIVETVASHFSSVPYERYLFITHFFKNKYGGLEHHDSTALHFDGRKLGNRKDYLNFLALVAHEYFHTWNVKRIRPIELGPFDYQNENYTKLHWLTEGLTSFMDDLFVLRSGLSTVEEYLETQKANLDRYYSTPGKKFHSLEDSSFNAWIKLYRPDEFSDNSSISYYLKGGLVFKTLHFELKKKGKSVDDLLTLLWDRYLENPKVGVDASEVHAMIESLGGSEVLNKFISRVTTTEDIDFETYYNEIGAEFVWSESEAPYLGASFETSSGNVFVSKILIDTPAYRGGLNAGDEVIAVNRQRFSKDDASDLSKILMVGQKYTFMVSRLDRILEIEMTPEKAPRTLKEIKVKDRAKLLKALLRN